MKKFFPLFFLLCSFQAFACLNLYVVNEEGRAGVYNDSPPYSIYFNASGVLETLRRYEGYIRTARPEQKHAYISNYAVYLVQLGHIKEALDILRKLAIQHPGEYGILANLATAFELNGKPDSALHYMKQSLKLNPDSHEGSEWFHIRFLEATIKVRDENISPGDVNVLRLETFNEKIGEHIDHQLSERIPLSSSPNPLLAKALEEAADYFRKNVSVDWAVKIYAMSIGYTTDEKVITRLWSKIESARERIVKQREPKTPFRKTDPVRSALLKSNWKDYLKKDIVYWQSHRSHYENGLRIMEF